MLLKKSSHLLPGDGLGVRLIGGLCVVDGFLDGGKVAFPVKKQFNNSI